MKQKKISIEINNILNDTSVNTDIPDIESIADNIATVYPDILTGLYRVEESMDSYRLVVLELDTGYTPIDYKNVIDRLDIDTDIVINTVITINDNKWVMTNILYIPIDIEINEINRVVDEILSLDRDYCIINLLKDTDVLSVIDRDKQNREIVRSFLLNTSITDMDKIKHYTDTTGFTDYYTVISPIKQ